jgi:autotransporter-associated beta strand protein
LSPQISSPTLALSLAISIKRDHERHARAGRRGPVALWAALTRGLRLFALVPLLGATSIFAGSAQWLSNPISSDWNSSINWSAGGPPNATADVATFDSSLLAAVSLSSLNGTQVDSIVFTAAASAFTITAAPSTSLSVGGAGITNNSGALQAFVTAVDSGRHKGLLFFTNSATAGINTAFTNNGGTVSGANGGETIFDNTSTASSGTFTNNGATISNANGGNTEFFNSSTAASGVFNNFAGTVSGAKGGFTEFFTNSTAGNATLVAAGGTGGGGSIIFANDSTGGTAHVQVFGGVSGGVGQLDISAHNPPGISIGSLEGNRGAVFLGANNLTVGSSNSSTNFAGTIQNGGAAGGTGGSFTKVGSGSFRFTKANSYTGPTTINAGTLSEDSGGFIADTSALTVNGSTAIFDLSPLGSSHNDTVGTVTVDGGGSITGIGTSTLTSTGSFEMKNGSVGVVLAGSGIALNKTTGGSVTLTGANTYTGATTINAGFLAVDNNGTTTFGSLGSGLTTTNGDNGSGFFGVLQFQHNATAGNGAFTNNTGAGGEGGFTEFFNTSTAGNSTFTNNGAVVSGAFGGTTEFLDTSTAGNSILIANGGLGVFGGGTILFYGDSAGSTARVEIFGNAYLDISNHNAPGVSIGSIEGTGNVALGANNLTVGGNNQNTLFSGAILDGGSGGGLTKTGTGTLTLSGANAYAGATIISDGLLLLTGSLGNSAVTVTFPGELSGTGTINGPLVNNGIVDLTGGTLTINNSVTNNGLFIVSNSSNLAGVTSFTNNAKLDIITAGNFIPPNGFVNNGVIIDSSVVKTKTVSFTGTTISVTIDSYTGHTYRLQASISPESNAFGDVVDSPLQPGATGTVLTFTDANAVGTTGFYRLVVNP